MRYTDAQRAAITKLDKHLAVTAGAGAGKTRVLVDRYINILKKRQAGVDGIVAITFTERAAAEMTERIRKAVTDEMQIDETGYWADIKEQLTNAYISTIHSFCGRMLRENPVEAELDPFFEIATPARASIWLDEAVKEAALAMIENESAVIAPLVIRFGFNALCNNVRNLYNGIMDKGYAIEEAGSITDISQPGAKAIIELLKLADAIYKGKKMRFNMLDYDDMQRKALELLKKPELRKRYHEQFKFIMLDEAQDINYIQYRLITNLVSDASSLFVVGDAKQSIYRFRGSDVGLFNKLSKEIAVAGGEVITMAENFRSTGGIIEFVNNQFANLIDDYQPVKAVRIDHGKVAVETIIIRQNGTMDSRKDAEADALAKRIKEMVDGKEAVIYDDKSGEFYAPRYSDIAVLFQKRTHLGAFKKAFDKYGIPYKEIGGGSFYGCQEIKDIINAMKCIIRPSDILSLVGTLKAFFDIGDETLVVMSSRGGIGQALDATHGLPEPHGHCAETAANSISKWRALAPALNALELVQLILDESDYTSRLLSQQDGLHKLSNIWKFCDMAEEAVHSGMSVSDFLSYIKVMGNADEEGQAPLELKGDDAVSIMTVHAAKGLEFPVVAIPDISSPFRSDASSMAFDMEIGIGIKPENGENESIWQKIKDKAAQEQQAEYKRLMYVALTRAKDKLILSVDEDGKKHTQSSWWEWLKANGIIETKNDRIDAVAAVSNNDQPAAQDSAMPSIAVSTDESAGMKYIGVTSLATYMQCPRQYYYENVAKLNALWFPQESAVYFGEGGVLTPAQIGDIVHSVCEKLKSPDEIELLVDSAITSLGVNGELRAKMADMVRAYAASPYFGSDADEVMTEQPFILKLNGDIALTGRIDRIIIKDGQATIVDFKTGYMLDEEAPEEYKLQLQAYAMAAMQIFGYSVNKAVIYYLGPDKAYNVDISEQALRGASRRILEAAKQLEAANGIEDFEPSRMHCARCSYRIC